MAWRVPMTTKLVVQLKMGAPGWAVVGSSRSHAGRLSAQVSAKLSIRLLESGHNPRPRVPCRGLVRLGPHWPQARFRVGKVGNAGKHSRSRSLRFPSSFQHVGKLGNVSLVRSPRASYPRLIEAGRSITDDLPDKPAMIPASCLRLPRCLDHAPWAQTPIDTERTPSQTRSAVRKTRSGTCSHGA